MGHSIYDNNREKMSTPSTPSFSSILNGIKPVEYLLSVLNFGPSDRSLTIEVIPALRGSGVEFPVTLTCRRSPFLVIHEVRPTLPV